MEKKKNDLAYQGGLYPWVNTKAGQLDLGIRTKSHSSYDIVVSFVCYEAL